MKPTRWGSQRPPPSVAGDCEIFSLLSRQLQAWKYLGVHPGIAAVKWSRIGWQCENEELSWGTLCLVHTLPYVCAGRRVVKLGELCGCGWVTIQKISSGYRAGPKQIQKCSPSSQKPSTLQHSSHPPIFHRRILIFARYFGKPLLVHLLPK